ncbi:MAG: hypothetical protein AB7S38_12120 [Vulcanimicrobiota bacterium]
MERILDRVGYPLAELRWTGMQEFPYYQRELAPSRLPTDTQVCWDPGSGYYFAFHTTGVEWRGVFSPSKAFVRASYVVDSWHSIPGFLYIWAEELAEELKTGPTWKGAEDASGGRNLLKRSQLNLVGQALQEAGVDLTKLKCVTTGPAVIFTHTDESMKFSLTSPTWTTFSGQYAPGDQSFSDLNWVKVIYQFQQWGKAVREELELRALSAEERAERERQKRQEAERLEREERERREREEAERLERERLEREQREREEAERLEQERLEREESEKWERLEARVRELEEALAEAQQERERLEQELAEVRQRLAEEVARRQNLETEFDEAREQLTNEQERADNAEAELEARIQELELERTRRENFEAEVPQLRQDLNAALEARQHLEQQLEGHRQREQLEASARQREDQDAKSRTDSFLNDLWRLRGFRLEGIRGLRVVEHRLAEQPRSLALLAGDNGTGKTSALVALAVGLSQVGEAHTILRTPAAAGLIPEGQDEAGIVLEFEGPEGRVEYCRTSLGLNSRGEQIVLEKDPGPDLLVVGFGSARAAGSLALPNAYSVLAGCRTLLGFDPRLADTEQVLRRLRLKMGAADFAPILTQLASLLPVEGLKLELDEHGLWVEQGTRLPVSRWSNGLRGVLAWVAELIGWAILSGRLEDDLNAVLLLDEADLHLQAPLQARLLGGLCQGLPGLQVVATSLSANVSRSVMPEELVQL